MNKQIIIEYIRQNGGIEIPALQQKFNLSFKEARDIVAEQVAANNLRYDKGLWFASTIKAESVRAPRVPFDEAGLIRKGASPESISERNKRMDKYLHELRDIRMERIRRKLALTFPVNTAWESDDKLKEAADKEMKDLIGNHKTDSLDVIREYAYQLYEQSLSLNDAKKTELYGRLVYDLGNLSMSDFLALKRRLFD